MTKSAGHSAHIMYLHRVISLMFLIMWFVGHLWGQSHREYVYMDGRLIAVENIVGTAPQISNVISFNITNPDYSVRPNGADHRWVKVPLR